MNLYLDASALVKRHIDEVGTPDVKRVFGAARVVGTSIISRAETEAALAKAVRTGNLSESEARMALNDFRSDWPDFARIPVTESLVRRAGALAFDEKLRGYDAVQLASALMWKEGIGEELTFATFDVVLWEAAGRHLLARFPEDLPNLL